MWFPIKYTISLPHRPHATLYDHLSHSHQIHQFSLPILHQPSCEVAEMGKYIIGFSLIFSSFFIGLVVAADWNILNIKAKNVWVGDSLKKYCESWRINVEINNIREFKVVPQECVPFIKKYMTSSQYKADSERALEEVTLYLTSCCTLEGDGKDAWIFDVDDTLLSTIPYFKKNGFG